MGAVICKRLITYKVICFGCLLSTTVALCIVLGSPTSGFEVSIYASTPLAFWILFAFNVSVCILLLFNEAKVDNKDKRWLFALGLLMANSILVLQLSVLRGYYAVGSDTLVHIGYVKDMANWILSTQNVYPAVHVIPALFVLIGLSPRMVVNIAPMIYYLVYVASFYGLSRTIWAKKHYTIIATTLSAFLLLPSSVGFQATMVGAAMFPMILLLIIKFRIDFKIKYAIAFLIILGVLSFSHPLVLETAIISLVVACFMPLEKRWRYIVATTLFIFLAVGAYSIFLELNVFVAVFKSVIGGVGSLLSTLFSSPARILPQIEGIRATQITGGSNLVILLLGRYGSEIILGVLAIIPLCVMAKRYMCKLHLNTWHIYFSILFIIFNLMWVAGWYLQLGVCEAVFSRMLNWVPLVSIILVTPMIANSQRLRKLLLVVPLIVIALWSPTNLYPSMITGSASAQVTYQHVNAINWLLDTGDPDTPIIHMDGHRVSRFIQARYGMEWCRENQEQYWLHERNYPRGFSYNEKESIGLEYPKDVYLVVTKVDKMMPRWEDDKLHLLLSDPATTLIYKDGDEIEIWFVESLID